MGLGFFLLNYIFIEVTYELREAFTQRIYLGYNLRVVYEQLYVGLRMASITPPSYLTAHR